jgi:alpha-ribazole phosphatase
MTIYLVRHTTPFNAKGLCYGFTDIDIDESFFAEAEIIKNKLPPNLKSIYSSPLKRCTKLANYVFDSNEILYENDLRELNFGNWENKLWNNIPHDESKYWMEDYVYQKPPNGESYFELFTRATKLFATHTNIHPQGFVWITHSGIIRSILSYITKTNLQDSFNCFKIEYGDVIKIELLGKNYSYTIM